MESIYIILLSILIIILLLGKRKYNKHTRNIKKANKIINKLTNLEYPGQKIKYLRKIDPFVFEELLLTSFKTKGYKIKRNKKYTGDGGIDGIIYDSNKNKIIIQAKRYSGYVNLQDLYEFNNLVYSNKAYKGYFVHTGKTGKKAHKHFKNSNIEIISGSSLINLIENKTL
ncbi:restriction endonuclease (plasmid) [Aquimarina sp. TRL1]|uniref:restriction endonuclease n=1 Tax=Aquimarina sp. (strain TRL1) TaxID=2736252 RepID=UPI00158DF078|nr:restriction endonuclease [Aquimarina sp. TRL1]QKX07725.1 restriction endonuclease [Aquimarina sp. TRL1]